MTARPDLSAPALAQLRLGKGRFGWAWHVLPWGAAIATYFVAGAYLSLGTAALEMILFTLSIDLALGYAGIITFGQAAFFGVGAYAAGLLSIHITPDPILGLLFGTAIAAVLGLVTGMLILHTEGVTLMMLTLAIASMISAFAFQAGSLTGGDNGLQGMHISPLFGLFPFDLWGNTAYLYALGVLFLWFVAAWRIVRSPFGRSLDGIRQSPRRMRAIGTPVWWRLVAVYTLAAAMAGTAGALKAQTNQFVGLDSLDLLVSGTALVMLILGGTRRLYGAFVGAAFYVVVQDIAAEFDPFRWMFVIGGLLVVMVLFLEGGLMGLADWARDAAARLWAGTARK
ncbi:MAG TPA: branched-chain amino acid ABC transporter permease [Stellaceae bacterium]|jgi:branched-chain amino acid transport system permease protein|nr:branched-chain amino acid ABC transporter permease [Stellaceae bacterium]